MGPIASLPALRFALLVMGFSATAGQILIIRELLVIFHGNEFSIGIIFGAWLILEAVGSYSARSRAEKSLKPISRFALMQIFVGLSPLLSILIIRSFKYLFGISTGETLGPAYTAAVSILAIAPIALPDGALFPFGCRNLSAVTDNKESPARTYLYEGLGSFAAGLAFVLYLIHYLESLELAMIILLLNLLSAVMLLTYAGRSPAMRNSAIALSAVAAMAFMTPAADWLHKKSSELLWYEYTLVETINSVYSNIAVIRHGDEFTFFANGAPYATTPAPASKVEETAHFSLLFHERPEDILLIGGGVGGLLREILKHPAQVIDYAEQDPLVIESFRRFATPLTEYELNHETVNIHPLEGRLFLKKTGRLYDVVLINLPIPSTLQLNRYYTTEFFELALSRLKHKGILSINLPGSEVLLSAEFRDLNRTIYKSLKTVFPHVKVIVGEQNIFLASKAPDIEAVEDTELIGRLRLRGITAGLMDEQYITYKMDRLRFGPMEEEIAGTDSVSRNHDLIPRGVFESMLFFNRAVSPSSAKLLSAADAVPFFIWPGLTVMLTLSLVVIQKRQAGLLFINYAVASTGFMSMFLSIALILHFQIYYGYVYHFIGLLASVFMFGSALGAFSAMKRPATSLPAVEALILFLGAAAYLFGTMNLSGMIFPQVIIYFLMAGMGFLTGMEYQVAVGLSMRYGSAATPVSGRLYAVDLLGAFLGAILTAVFFIPTMGIQKTLLIAICLKAGSLFLVYTARPLQFKNQGPTIIP